MYSTIATYCFLTEAYMKRKNKHTHHQQHHTMNFIISTIIKKDLTQEKIRIDLNDQKTHPPVNTILRDSGIEFNKIVKTDYYKVDKVIQRH